VDTSVKLFEITQENSQGIYKTVLIAIMILLFVSNCVLFLNKARVSEIMNKYKGESETKKKVGSVWIILYVIFSLGLIAFT
jgi:hypothetical protein